LQFALQLDDMRLRYITLVLILVGITGWAAWAASGVAPAGAEVGTAAELQELEAHGDGGHGDEHGRHELPAYAVELFKIGPFRVTNSMVVTWIVALTLILSVRMATRRIREVPTGAQNFWEWLVESLHDFLEGIIGADLVKKTFWFFATLFIFILFTELVRVDPRSGLDRLGASR
jgi:F-type H+-transporting ATPase subunit a